MDLESFDLAPSIFSCVAMLKGHIYWYNRTENPETLGAGIFETLPNVPLEFPATR